MPGELDGALALPRRLAAEGSRLEDERVPLGRQVYREDVRKRELACVGLKIVSSTAG